MPGAKWNSTTGKCSKVRKDRTKGMPQLVHTSPCRGHPVTGWMDRPLWPTAGLQHEAGRGWLAVVAAVKSPSYGVYVVDQQAGLWPSQAEHLALLGSQHVTGCNLRDTQDLVVPQPAAWQLACICKQQAGSHHRGWTPHLWIEQGVGCSTAEADRQQLLCICEGLAPHQHTVKVSLILQTSHDMPRTLDQLQESTCPLNCYQRKAGLRISTLACF